LSPAPEREDTARSAGRGGLAVAGAKLYFMVLGLAQQILLTRVLGTEGYGAFSRASAIANVANSMVVTSGILGVSRTVSQAVAGEAAGGAVVDGAPLAARITGDPQGAQRGALTLHAYLALPTALAFAALASAFVLGTGAPHLLGPILVAAIVVLGYSLYAPLVGALNGRNLLVRQAFLDTVYATGRTLAMLVGGWLLVRQGLGPTGAMGGMALASLLIIPAAAYLAGLGKPGPGAPTAADYLRFIAPVALGQLFLNTLMQSDISLLGYFATQSALGAGLTGDEVARAADRSAAIYKSCQLYSFLPYQLLISINFVLFPRLAAAHKKGDAAEVSLYVQNGLRLGYLLAGGMVAVIFGLGPSLLRLTFPADIADHGGTTLRTLAVGQGAFALYGVLANILTSLGKERWTMALNALATAVLVLFAALLVPGSAVGAPIAERTAIATSLALGLVLVAGAVLVRRVAGALMSPLVVLRVAAAAALTGGLGLLLTPPSKLLVPPLAAGLGLVYLVILIGTGELGRTDLAFIGRVLGKKAG
jgi:stage V sporulation protein B